MLQVCLMPERNKENSTSAKDGKGHYAKNTAVGKMVIRIAMKLKNEAVLI